MHSNLLAFYAGPDQVMTVTSGLASILGMLLIFWHKLVAAFNKILNKFRSSSSTPAATEKSAPPQNS